jgi:uncharacterized protein
LHNPAVPEPRSLAEENAASLRLQCVSAQLAEQYRAPRIVKLELILTEACNLKCSYCFEYGAQGSQTMTAGTAQKAIDFLIGASRQSAWVGISFMGGEPMICFNLIKDVVSYALSGCKAAGKRVTFDMQTNGLLIKEEHAQFFRKVGLRYCLSLDGEEAYNDRHRRTVGGGGTFGVVAAKLPMFKRYQNWQGARVTVMPDSAADLARNVSRLHEDLAINQFVIGFATHVDWHAQQIADYAHGLRETFDYFLDQRIAKRSNRIRIGLFELGEMDEAYIPAGGCGWGCGAGSGRIAVSPSGQFHGCSKLAWSSDGGSHATPLPLGSVDTGLSRPKNRRNLLDHSEGPRIKCRSCEIARFCQGGCYAANLVDTGNMYEPADYLCKLMFAQKCACDYARSRLKEFGIETLRWGAQTPVPRDLDDLSIPRQP